MRSLQIFLHPALLTDLHRRIDIVVVVRHCGGSRTGLSVAFRNDRKCSRRREGDLSTIGGSHGIDRVSPHVVGRSRVKAAHLGGEVADARARGHMFACYCGIMRRAPANAALHDSAAAIGKHIAAERGRHVRDVRDSCRGDRSGITAHTLQTTH